MNKKSILAALAALTLSACSAVDRHKLVTEDGRYVGDVFNVRHSQDGCGWQVVNMVYDPKGQLQEHKIGHLPGLSCAALDASARIGGAAVFGHSLPKNVGDNINAGASATGGSPTANAGSSAAAASSAAGY